MQFLMLSRSILEWMLVDVFDQCVEFRPFERRENLRYSVAQ